MARKGFDKPVREELKRLIYKINKKSKIERRVCEF